MRIENLVDVMSAAHLSAYVESPYVQRGGLMLVAPPGAFKTTIIKSVGTFPNCKVLSDVNVQTLNSMHADFSGNVYRTLAFTDFQKIYERHDSTAINVEGTIKGLVDEGFRHSAFNDQRMIVREARCLVIGGMTTDLYTRKFTKWKDSGFLRRFIWCHFVMANPLTVLDAIDRWELLNVYGKDPVVFALPGDSKIPYQITPQESGAIREMLKHHETQPSAFVLLKKIYCVLQWRYPEETHGPKAWEVLQDFSECLSPRGADLELATKPGTVWESEKTKARRINTAFAAAARKHKAAKREVVA